MQLFRHTIIALTGMTSLVGAGPALAFDDWDVSRSEDGRTQIAYLEFDSGVVIATRCSNRSFAVLLRGVDVPPPTKGPALQSRRLTLAIDGRPEFTNSWVLSEDGSTLISVYPLTMARILAQGMRLTISPPAEDGVPVKRYSLDIPASAAAVAATMTACGKQLADEQPQSSPPEAIFTGYKPDSWAQRASPQYPMTAMSVKHGQVSYNCIVQSNGRLNPCEVESEYPAGLGFGRSTLDALRSSRLNMDTPPPLVAGQRVVGTNHYRLD